MLTIADGGGIQEPLILADVICEQPLSGQSQSGVEPIWQTSPTHGQDQPRTLQHVERPFESTDASCHIQVLVKNYLEQFLGEKVQIKMNF